MSTNQFSKTERSPLASGSSRWLLLGGVVALIVIALDVLTKWLVEREIGPGAARSHVKVIGSFVELRNAGNAGIAFGMLEGRSTIAGILVGIVIVPLLIVLVFMASRGPAWALGGGLVLGGAAGNLIDRIGDQTVTDFISVGRWPSFNLADSAITLGALILIGLSLSEHRAGDGAA